MTLPAVEPSKELPDLSLAIYRQIGSVHQIVLALGRDVLDRPLFNLQIVRLRCEIKTSEDAYKFCQKAH